jgi:hypothetical protein
MHSFERIITRANAEGLIGAYLASVEEIGNSLGDFKTLRLLHALKRDALGNGPYPHVTMFEAANRILSDLVIFYGVKWLVDNPIFPFDAYTVEYGNENNNGFDIRAAQNGTTLIGEAFNVAPSFFQAKKSSALKKLRGAPADHKIVMFNHDAVEHGYEPQPRIGEYFVCVHVGTSECSIFPRRSRGVQAGQ